mgnify:FL=1
MTKSRNRVVIGVDSGVKGSLTIGSLPDLSDAEIFTTQTTSELIEIIEGLVDEAESDQSLVAIVENPPPFAGNFKVPSSSIYKLGVSFGEITGIIRAFKIPLHLVRPRDWQKGIPGLTKLKGYPRKRALADHAKRLFPHLPITVRNADSVLILNHFFSQPVNP